MFVLLLSVAQAAHGAAPVVMPSGSGAQPARLYVAPGATWTGQLVADVHDDWHGASTVRYYLHRPGGAIELSVPADMPIGNWLGQHVALQGFGTDARIDVIGVAPSALPAPTAAATAEPLLCSTAGDQKTAVILMNQPTKPFRLDAFPVSYWQEQFFSSSPKSVHSFLVEASSGQASMSGEVFGPFDFDRDYACEEALAASFASFDAAIAAGVDLSPYTRFATIYMGFGGCSGGSGGYGCSTPDERVPNQYSRMNIFLPTPVGPAGVSRAGVLAHELGHNFLLTHANKADFGSMPLGALDAVMRDPGQGTDGVPGTWALFEEYGDPYSLMGFTAHNQLRSFSARDELALGWMAQADHREVMSSGDFVLEPYQLADGLRAIRILREPSNSSWLWLEYRQPIGAYDSDISDAPQTNLFEGAYVRYEDTGVNVSGGVTAPLKALHFNPAEAPNSYALAAMTPGQSWSDPHTPLRLEVNRGDSSGLSVSAHFEEPCAELAATYVDPDLVIDVTAPETCTWQPSVAADWLTLASAGDGRGNGTIRYSAAPNDGERQRRAYITVDRQAIPVVQKGTGAFVHPLPSPHIIGTDAALALTVDFPGGASYAFVDVQLGRCWVRAEHRPPEAPRVALVLSQQEVALGSAGSVSDDDCTLRGAGSQVEFSGERLEVVFDLGLKATYGSFPIRLESASDTSSAGALVVGTWTVELPTQPMPLPPDSPAGLTATAADGLVTLTWSAAERAVSYRVYRSSEPGQAGTEVKAAIGGTDTVIADLAGGTHHFTVKAVNSAGLSAPSNEVGVTLEGGGGGAIDPRLLLLLASMGLLAGFAPGFRATASDPPRARPARAAASARRATAPRGG